MSLHTTLISLTSAKRLERRDQVLAIDRSLASAFEKVLGEGRIVGDRDAVRQSGRRLRPEMEPRHAHQGEKAAPVADLGVLDDAAGAPERIKLRARVSRLLRLGRLDDPDEPLAGKRVVEHLEIARLEHGELDRPARQEKRPGKRKERDRLRHLGRPGEGAIELHGALLILRTLFAADRCQNQIADSLRRAATDSGSIRPQASKNCNNCLRAASSFHLRSR